jgi:hypothetical protein
MARVFPWMIALGALIALLVCNTKGVPDVGASDFSEISLDSCTTVSEPPSTVLCWSYDFGGLFGRVNRDLDFHVQDDIPHTSNNESKIGAIVAAMDDIEGANFAGKPWYDLQLVFNYFGAQGSLYGSSAFLPNFFELFPLPEDSASHDNHVDIYLRQVPDSTPSGSMFCLNGSPIYSIEEDGTSQFPPGQNNSTANEVSCPAKGTDLIGLDPLRYAMYYMHEFTHKLLASRHTTGDPEKIPPFATYLSGNSASILNRNEIYDVSLLLKNQVGDSLSCGDWKMRGDSHPLTALWNRWLLERFPGPDPDAPEDDLFYQWVRADGPSPDIGRMTMWTLARTLENGNWNAIPSLPSSALVGDGRLARIFRRHAMARWMDPDASSQGVSLDTLAFPISPSNVSPVDYCGLFKNHLSDGPDAVYVPPTIVVDEASICTVRFLPDRDDPEARESWVLRSPVDQTCDFVATPVWGSSYYVFEAGEGVDGAAGLTLDLELEVVEDVPRGARVFFDEIEYDDKGSLYAKPGAVVKAGWGKTSSDGRRNIITVEGFGATTKSVVAVVSVVEDSVSTDEELSAVNGRYHTRYELSWVVHSEECVTKATESGPANLLVCPAGDGGAIDVLVQVYDRFGKPRGDVPAEDVYLKVGSETEDWAHFTGASRVEAEHPTWPNGVTTIHAEGISGCSPTNTEPIRFEVYVEDEVVHSLERTLRSPDVDGDDDVDADDLTAFRNASPCTTPKCRDLDFNGSCEWSDQTPGDTLAFYAHLNHAASFLATPWNLSACPAGDASTARFEFRGQAAEVDVSVVAEDYDPDAVLPCGSDVVASGTTDAGGSATLQAARFGGAGPIVFDFLVDEEVSSFHPWIVVDTDDDEDVDCNVSIAQEETSPYSYVPMGEGEPPAPPGPMIHCWHGDHSSDVIVSVVFPYDGAIIVAGYGETIEWTAYADQVEQICLSNTEPSSECSGAITSDYSAAVAAIDYVEVWFHKKATANGEWESWQLIGSQPGQNEGPDIDIGHWYYFWEPNPSQTYWWCQLKVKLYALDGRVTEALSDGTFEIFVPPPSCPTLLGWTGESYRPLNSLLSLGGPPESTERLDALHLPWLPDTTGGNLRLQVVESEAETSWVDQAAVAVVDHPLGTRLAVTQEGRPFIAGTPVGVDSALTVTGESIGLLLRRSDGEVFHGAAGDTIYVTLPNLAGKEETGEEGGIGMDSYKPPEEGKMAQTEEIAGNEPGISIEMFSAARHRWLPVGKCRPRDTQETSVIDRARFVEGGRPARLLRLVWSGRVDLDAVSLIPAVTGSTTLTRVGPHEAAHSQAGDVVGALTLDDGAGVQLVLGERVDLLFRLPPVVEQKKRDFVFLSRGWYRPVVSASKKPDQRIPAAFFATPARPNPTSATTIVDIGLPKPTEVTLRIFDLSGREIRRVLTTQLPAGYHQLVWDGRDDGGRVAPGGVYFYKLVAGRHQKSGRVVVLR